MMRRLWFGGMIAALAACNPAEDTLRPDPGVVYTFPSDGQLDVPLGARIVVTFSDPVTASALAPCSGTAAEPVGALCVVGPDGPVAVTAEAIGDGTIVQLTGAALVEGTTYAVYARSELAPTAKNLPTSGPLFRFTTRRSRGGAAAPSVLSVNGASPDSPEAFRPMFETSTIRLVFSQPLDPRSVALAPGAIELVDAGGSAVPATLLTDGIHVSIDPIDDLAAGAPYQLKIGSQIIDIAGHPATPLAIPLTPRPSGAAHPIPQVLRTRAADDRGPAVSHVGAASNAIALTSPLIGSEMLTMLPSTLAVELGDPVLGGPLAFTIRRGQRLRASGLDVKLGGVVPAGLSTGEIVIELLSDSGGRIYRNPHQPEDLRPDNERSPLLADLSMDFAMYAVDPAGNAVLTQTVLGVQGSGVVIADEGVLDIEAAIALDLDLLGLASAPTNLVLELITDPTAAASVSHTPPSLLAALPSTTAAPSSNDTAVELIFSEPIDLDRARAGGVQLETSSGQVVPSVIESHGAALALRPITPLAAGASYRVALNEVTDVAGNPLATADPPTFSLPVRLATTAPMMVSAIHPGVPCALTGGSDTTPGHCRTAIATDDNYHPFTLAANDAIDVRFTQPPASASVTLGAACNTGSVRVEEVAADGTCAGAVAGAVRLRDRALSFVPDRAWQPGKRYRLTLISGTDAACNAGEICGPNAVAASFSPLARDTQNAVVRSNLVIDFTAVAASARTLATMEAAPISDLNGSGKIEPGESVTTDNRVALRITGVGGIVSNASFPGTDCVPATAEPEACMAVSAALPVELLPAAHDCPLPGGGTAASCVPVAMSPQVVLATSLPLNATAIQDETTISISTNTGLMMMRMREPAAGPAMGYIIDDHGTPTLVALLDVYLDAPDMRILTLTHDLHSKALSIAVRGPVRFLADGRIAITASNVADVPIEVNIQGTDTSGTITGAVKMLIPTGGLTLQLVSPPLRGGSR